LTDPDARSMATSGKGTGIVGYNVQTAVDVENHLIVSRLSPRKACEEFPLLHVPQAAGRFAAPRRSVPPILVGQSLQRRGPECYAFVDQASGLPRQRP
jgi:hypothetical protein